MRQEIKNLLSSSQLPFPLSANPERDLPMKSIMSLLRQIDNGEIVLPAIQRNFVWHERKIERLMDSILRGYPVGIVLMWETYNDIQYRRFEKIYKESTARDFRDNRKKRKLTLSSQARCCAKRILTKQKSTTSQISGCLKRARTSASPTRIQNTG